MQSNRDKYENTNYWPLLFLSVGVVSMFGFSWWWLATTINNPEKQGLFGDQFGAVNALFSESWNLNLETWILKPESWILNPESWNLNLETWNLNLETWILKQIFLCSK